nr:hypothetical protein CFP56_00097 [Quercus suber]
MLHHKIKPNSRKQKGSKSYVQNGALIISIQEVVQFPKHIPKNDVFSRTNGKAVSVMHQLMIVQVKSP